MEPRNLDSPRRELSNGVLGIIVALLVCWQINVSCASGWSAIQLYDNFIWSRKMKNSAFVGIVSTLGFPQRIHLPDPKNTAKNDKSFADMAIGSQRPFKLWTLSPNRSWSTWFIVLACQMCPQRKNLWQKTHDCLRCAELKNSHIVSPEGAGFWWPYSLFGVARGDLSSVQWLS